MWQQERRVKTEDLRGLPWYQAPHREPPSKQTSPRVPANHPRKLGPLCYSLNCSWECPRGWKRCSCWWREALCVGTRAAKVSVAALAYLTLKRCQHHALTLYKFPFSVVISGTHLHFGWITSMCSYVDGKCDPVVLHDPIVSLSLGIRAFLKGEALRG